MNRRDLLASGSVGAVFLPAGCLASVPTPIGDTPTPTPSAKERCADRKFPERHLGLIKLQRSKHPDDPSTIIHFGELPPAERTIVERAIEQDRYTICLPEAPNDRVDAFSSLVERIKDHTPAVPSGAYLEYEDSYYRFTHVRTEDMVFVTARS